MSKKILVLPGDYIGPEIIAEAVKVLERVSQRFNLGLDLEYGLLGGAAIDAHGVPLPESTLERARVVDAILLGAVGGPKWDGVERSLRPEKGLLGGMMELPSTAWRAAAWDEAEALAQAPFDAPWAELPGVVRHTFTHFHLELEVYRGRATGSKRLAIRLPRAMTCRRFTLSRTAATATSNSVRPT